MPANRFLVAQVPKRVTSTPAVLRAMSEVSNEEISRVMVSPYILYVRGKATSASCEHGLMNAALKRRWTRSASRRWKGVIREI